MLVTSCMTQLSRGGVPFPGSATRLHEVPRRAVPAAILAALERSTAMAGASLTIPADHGITKMRWRCLGIAEEIVATFGWQLDTLTDFTAAATNRDPNVAAKSWTDAWHAAFANNTLQSDWSLAGADVSFWSADQEAGGVPVPPAQGTYNVNFQGSGAWRCVPANCALLVEKGTATAGRMGKGRAYLPGGYISSGEVVASGGISSPATTGYNANLENLITNLGDDAVRIFLRLFHGQRHSGNTVIGPGADPSEVTSLTCDTRVATQRRRMHR